jgi:hypothetical protein
MRNAVTALRRAALRLGDFVRGCALWVRNFLHALDKSLIPQIDLLA